MLKVLQPMEKDQLIHLNLWSIYWHYLISLEQAFLKELKEKIPHVQIHSWIESQDEFFGPEGQTDKVLFPELEEIYFQLDGHKNRVRICIRSANTQHPQLELVHDDEKYNEHGDDAIAYIFSSDAVGHAIIWMKGE